MQYLSSLFVTRKQSNQQNLIEFENQKTHDIFKNRLLLTSFANLLIFLVFIFAMSYYDWAAIRMPLYLINESESNFIVEGYLTLYVNLIYGKQTSLPYYQSYSRIATTVCIQTDIYCFSIFDQLMFIGVLTFIILTIGSLIQGYDIYKMIVYFVKGESNEDYGQKKQDHLRHILTIGHFFIGITLNIFGLVTMDVDIYLGYSFWTFVGGMLLFIVVIVIEQIALANLRRQNLILDIIKKQNKITNNIEGTSIELSSENDVYI